MWRLRLLYFVFTLSHLHWKNEMPLIIAENTYLLTLQDYVAVSKPLICQNDRFLLPYLIFTVLAMR